MNCGFCGAVIEGEDWHIQPIMELRPREVPGGREMTKELVRVELYCGECERHLRACFNVPDKADLQYGKLAALAWARRVTARWAQEGV